MAKHAFTKNVEIIENKEITLVEIYVSTKTPRSRQHHFETSLLSEFEIFVCRNQNRKGNFAERIIFFFFRENTEYTLRVFFSKVHLAISCVVPLKDHF